MTKKIFPFVYLLFTFFFIFAKSSLFALLDSISTTNPPAMNITGAVAGQQPASVTVTNTYSVSTILAVRTISGQLNTNMPTGVVLSLSLQAPLGATSTGTQVLSTTAVNLVTNVQVLVLASGLTMTYTLSATVAAAPATAQTRVLTPTLF